MRKVHQPVIENIAVLLVESEKGIRIFHNKLKCIELTGQLRFCYVSVKLKGKGDQKLVSGAGIGIVFVSGFDLRCSLTFYQTVKFHYMSMIVNRLGWRCCCKIPVSQISKSRNVMLILCNGLIFLSPGKVIKQFFHLSSPFYKNIHLIR